MEPTQVVERDTVDRLYRLDGVSHVASNINDKPVRCITSIRRQQNMVLHGCVVPYLEAAGLYQVALLNNYWFKVDEPMISAFVEHWRPEMHTFHMPFGECYFA
ncbi:hypothetical protein PIB30_007220 [Stylosanthes scabra]|uniref:Aminotransferase-like plant mobile domain-containing protein n=1 Tax=Stylosanthes scabra TaxID=79078 RepID=A0ABU6V582_9FABA|nr:hypothetical protein [Stylosanthes scabra]